MKIVFFSDTHGAHASINLPPADIHIFTGDCCNSGSRTDATSFLNWFTRQDSKHKVMIAGNHDKFFENEPHEVEYVMPSNIHYLEDSGVEIEGIKIYGSPVTPYFRNWAFNRHRSNGKDYMVNGIKQHWNKIPEGLDILLAHGPSYGILDEICPKFRKYNEDNNVGCVDLKNAINNLINKPKIFAFGHIHETYGQFFDEETKIQHINSSIMTENYDPINDPIEIDWNDYKDEK